MTDGSTSQQQARNGALDSAFQVGNWQVDPGLNLIRDADSGEQRHLEPRLMKLLCFLAANTGCVVTRDELVNLLWPRVIVNENSLTRAVSELRKRLDAPATPARKAVQTIPKRGYRLNVAVQALPAPPPAAQTVAGAAERPWRAVRAGQHRGTPSALAASIVRKPERALAAAMTAGFLLLLSLHPGIQSDAPVLPGALAQLSDEVIYSEPQAELPVNLSTFNPGTGADSASERSAAGILSNRAIEAPVLSPDRKRFAFIEHNLAASSIYVGKTAGESTADFAPVEVLSVPYRLSNLTWSPVGNALLFARQDDLSATLMFGASSDSSELMRLDLDSGRVSRLVEDQQAPAESSPRETNLTFTEPRKPFAAPDYADQIFATRRSGRAIPAPTSAPPPAPLTPA